VVPLAAQPAAFGVAAGWLHAQWGRHRGAALEDVLHELAQRAHADGAPMAWVAMVGGEPVGTASIVHDDHPVAPGTTLCLADLFVPAQWRDHGVGSALCRCALAHACERGLGPLYVYTIGAEPFFRNLGWIPVMDAAVSSGGPMRLASFMTHATLPQAPPERDPNSQPMAVCRTGGRRWRVPL
jgi:predicted N-acetyltransferase YhbS